VLLVHPPIYDTRLHWPQWQQPIRLLRLASYARQVGATPLLIDSIHERAGPSIRRQRVGVLNLDGLSINKWRFGLAKSAFVDKLRQMARSDVQPDKVYIECNTT